MDQEGVAGIGVITTSSSKKLTHWRCSSGTNHSEVVVTTSRLETLQHTDSQF